MIWWVSHAGLELIAYLARLKCLPIKLLYHANPSNQWHAVSSYTRHLPWYVVILLSIELPNALQCPSKVWCFRARCTCSLANENGLNQQQSCCFLDILDFVQPAVRIDLDNPRGPAREFIAQEPVQKEIGVQFKDFLRNFRDDKGDLVYKDRLREMCTSKPLKNSNLMRLSQADYITARVNLVSLAASAFCTVVWNWIPSQSMADAGIP